MKILSIVPEVKDLTTAEMIAHMKKCLSPGVELIHESIKAGPDVVESEYDMAFAIPYLINQCIQAEKDGFDGIFVNCCGDPGVRAIRECVHIPVIGGTEAAAYIALCSADRIGIVTILPNVVPALHKSIAMAGLQDRIVSIRCVEVYLQKLAVSGIPFADFLQECIKAIEQDGVEALIIGCTAMFETAGRLQQALSERGYDVPVLDPAQCGPALLETLIRLQAKSSRITYMRPPCLK